MKQESHNNAPQYYEQAGRWHVAPYLFTFDVAVKGRWIGKSLVDTFTSEFQHHTENYYVEACRVMRLWVTRPLSQVSKRPRSIDAPTSDDCEVIRDPKCILQPRDHIFHCIHKHELSIYSSRPIIVLRAPISTLGVLVLNKPPSIPVHPSGRFNFNSVTCILEAFKQAHTDSSTILRSMVQADSSMPGEELEEWKAFLSSPESPKWRPCYRLDRSTSGVLVIGLSHAVASCVGKQLEQKISNCSEERENSLEKVYVARVSGVFPESQLCDAPIFCVDASTYSCHAAMEGGPVSFRATAWNEGKGKMAKTQFRRLATDHTLQQSVVECRPATGRTHQIRVHLAHLGFPIVNDVKYNSSLHNSNKRQEKRFFDAMSVPSNCHWAKDSLCAECDGDLPVSNYGEDGSMIYLHAWRYTIVLEGKSVVFHAPLPSWTSVEPSGE